MDKPVGVKQAIIALWGTIAITALCSLINKWIGVISFGEFCANLFVYGLVCILPYKINKGSNAARYVYLIFFIISVLLLLGGIGEQMPKLDLIISIFLIPVDIFIVYQLFQVEASRWFSRA